jgi:hypothetical protein
MTEAGKFEDAVKQFEDFIGAYREDAQMFP